jgi:hypothetical protein
VDLRLIEYLVYLAVSVGLTMWVGRVFQRNGAAYLADVLKDPALATSMNRLLVVGFYLISLGGVALLLNVQDSLRSPADIVRAVATKVGIVLLLLGVMHFCNMLVLRRLARPATQLPSPPAFRSA